MFIGHTAVAMAAKPIAPRASLGTLFTAAMLLDVIWPVLLLTGVERVAIDPHPETPFLRLDFINYPWTHSLLMACLWGALFGAGYFVSSRDRRAAGTIALLVVSHWVLDWTTHRPDLPLYPGGPKVRLGLWHSTWGTVAVETAMFVIGIGIYLRFTRAHDRIGSWGFWLLTAFLYGVYASLVVGPPPPSTTAVAWSALSAVLLLFWAAWVDRHRAASGPAVRV
jgi:membrane-bound metal-dependent hydrolase YbcI (DUF457 family)